MVHFRLGSKARLHMASADRELPLPIVTTVGTLDQAHATLWHCYSQLHSLVDEDYEVQTASPGAFQRYQDWLSQWERAFLDFLQTCRASMSLEDLVVSRLLKANHLAYNIIARTVSTETQL